MHELFSEVLLNFGMQVAFSGLLLLECLYLAKVIYDLSKPEVPYLRGWKVLRVLQELGFQQPLFL